MKGYIILNRSVRNGIPCKWERYWFKKWYPSKEIAEKALGESYPGKCDITYRGKDGYTVITEFKIVEFNIDL